VDRLCEGEFSSLASGSWGADGTLVVSDGERLLHVDPGVSCEPLPLPEGTWRRPRHSPDGTTVFANGQLGSGGGRLYDVNLASMDLRDLGPGMQAHPTDRGYLVVLSGTAASAVPYDFEARSPSGPPRTLATGVRLNFNGSTLDVVGDRLVYLERSGAGDRPDLIVRDGEVVDSIGGASGWTLAAANEAPWVAGGGSGVEIIDPETRTVRRVASAGLELAVSPGDSLIAVGSWRFSDDCGIALIDPASGEVRRTVRACLQPLDFTPDGGALLAHRVAVGSGDLFMVDLQSGQVDTLVAEEEPIRHAALSGDGRWMAYAVGGQVIVRAVQGGVPPSVVSGQAFAVRVDWHPTEPRVFFAATPGGIYSVDIGESGRPLGPPVLRFAARWNRVGALRSNGTLFQVLADGESLLLNGLPVRDDVVTDVVVLDGWTGVLAAGGVAER